MMDDAAWLEGETERVAVSVPTHGLTKRQLALALDWPTKRLDRACREGMPARTTGSNRGGLRFDLPLVIQWLVAQAAGDDTDSMAEAKRQLTLAQVRKKQIEADQLEGKLIEIDAVIALNVKHARELRANLIALSSQLPTLSAEQRDQVDLAVNEILTDMSQKLLGDDEFESESIAA